MASPITTQGFQIQARPGIEYADPRLFSGALTNILPGISQGVGTVGQVAGLIDNAQQAPIRRKLAEIQVANAERQGRADTLRLAQLQRPFETVTNIGIEETPRYPAVEELQPDGTVKMVTPAGADVFQIEEGFMTDPVTGERTNFRRRAKPLSTIEQQEMNDEKAALARAREESLAQQRILQAALAAERLNNPDWKRIGYGVDNNGFVVYTVQNSKTGETSSVPTQLTPAQSGLTGALTNLLGGGQQQPVRASMPNIAVPPVGALPRVALATAADAVAAEDVAAGLTAEDQALIDRAAAVFATPVPSPFKTPAIETIPSFANVAEAEAFAKTGALRKGDKIKVGGIPGTWQ